MKRSSLFILAALAFGCGPAQLVAPGDGDADTDVDTDTDTDTDTDIPYGEIGTTVGVHNDDQAMVLYVPADLLAVVDPCAALVGSYHGEVGDLHLYGNVQESDLGWAVTTSSTDRGLATTLREDIDESGETWSAYEYPFAYDVMPTGVYRAQLRTVLNCEALTGFENGLVDVGVAQLGDIDDPDAWGQTDDIESEWVWHGVDEWGDEVSAIVVEYDRENDTFSPAAEHLPPDLGDLDN